MLPSTWNMRLICIPFGKMLILEIAIGNFEIKPSILNKVLKPDKPMERRA